jgi:hypothetical protein
MPTLIDLDPRSQQAAKAIPGATFYGCMLEELSDPGPYGAIMMSQVLEHAMEPMSWLDRAADLLAPGGVLAVLLPNFSGVYRLLGASDPMIIPPIHLNHFTSRSLRLALAKAGLHVARVASTSQISCPKDSSPLQRLVRASWNWLSVPLNGTTRGIILHAYAMKP